MKKFAMKNILFEAPDAIEIEGMCFKLAKKIKRSKYRFDAIVAIGRGGWIPARYLADMLGNVLSLSHMKIEHYVGIAKTDRIRIAEGVSTSVKGKRILLVDDIPDTGESLVLAKRYLKRRGAREIRIACLHHKPWSIIEPDYFVAVTRKWIIHPWMRKENLEELKLKGVDLSRTGISEDEIKRILSL
jgi:hypoxanthine phosphoribosyltransferase